jgi:hypothetical protein
MKVQRSRHYFARLPAEAGAAVIALILAAAQAAAGAEPGQLPGWKIQQWTPLFGDYTLYVTPTAVKAVSVRWHEATITQAPAWDIVTYSDASKRYFRSPAKAWVGQTAVKTSMVFFGVDAARSNWKQVGSAKILSLDVQIYRLTRLAGPFERDKPDNPRHPDPEILKRYSRLPYYVTDDLKLPAAACDFITKLYGIPPLHKFPVRFKLPADQDRLSSMTYEVDTISCQPAVFSAKTFTVPSGYTLARSSMDVRMDPTKQEELKNLLGY